MSLTQSDSLFAALHEGGANDITQAFFRARPRLLNYGSPLFIPATTVAGTSMPRISFPGVPGGLEWAVRFTVPIVDFHPDSSGGMPPPLTLPPGRFSLRSTVTLWMFCGRRGESVDRVVETSLDLWAVGSLLVRNVDGTSTVGFRVDAVELAGVLPETLGAFLECMIRMMINAALAPLNIPLKAMTAGAFTLVLTRGPLIETDQVEIWGHL